MRHRKRGTHSAVAFNRLGLQWLEMMAASQAVIAHRLSRSNTPAEVFEMGSEKVDAALRASQALSHHLMRAPPTTPMAAWNAWTAMLASGMAPFHAKAVRNSRSMRSRAKR